MIIFIRIKCVMTYFPSKPCTAFSGTRQIAAGPLIDVALAIKAAEEGGSGDPVLTFDDATGKVLDLDLRGTPAEIAARLEARGEPQSPVTTDGGEASGDMPAKARGRPRLGVVAREVTLLPRHWEWLSAQPGGASQALRRIVDEARRSDSGGIRAKAARERTYRVLLTLAGDMTGFEEAIRALFAGQDDIFAERIAAWPSDARDYALRLARADPAEDRST